MSEKPRILIVEDDPEIRALLEGYLKRNDFRCDVADGGAALDRFLQTYGEPDLIVLDLMLPGEDGLSICRRLRANSRVPIIMLTAKSEDIDRIIGLEMGADDYLAKPFNPRELVARIRAILRRNAPAPVAHRRLAMAEFVIDLDARSVVHSERGTISLTTAEFDLLECFLQHPGRVLSRDQLMDWTRGRTADTFDRTIDVQVSRLRKKLEERGDAEADPGTPGPGTGDPMIKTLRNAGYMLCRPVKEA
jgi:two-component system, OmpR family, response regulator